jgi:hypothetical protein
MGSGTLSSEVYPHPRREARAPMEVGVQISGHAKMPGVEMTFTENVSSGGARVRSVRRWRPNVKLWISTLTGSFRSQARVAYCEPERGEGFAIGVEFLEPGGPWVVTPGSRAETEIA